VARRIAIEPQFVCSCTVQVRPDASRCVGRRTRRSRATAGARARSQPAGSARAGGPCVVAGVEDPVDAGSSSPPHAARPTATASSRASSGRFTAGQDTLGPIVPVAAALRPYDHVLVDLDGCVWVGDAPTPRAQEAIAALREARKGIAFVTNDGRHADEEFVRKLWRLGFQASREEVVTVGGAIQHVLADSGHRTAYVIGSAPVHRHVADAGLRILNASDLAVRADVVVVAAHDGFDFGELRGAVQAVLRGATVLCAGRDMTFPMPDGPWPGTGAVVAALGPPPARPHAASASPSRSSSSPRWIDSAPGVRSWWATISTPTPRARGRPAWTARSS
jgi:hypothetical protein